MHEGVGREMGINAVPPKPPPPPSTPSLPCDVEPLEIVPQRVGDVTREGMGGVGGDVIGRRCVMGVREGLSGRREEVGGGGCK